MFSHYMLLMNWLIVSFNPNGWKFFSFVGVCEKKPLIMQRLICGTSLQQVDTRNSTAQLSPVNDLEGTLFLVEALGTH